jgi:hypothetical protein
VPATEMWDDLPRVQRHYSIDFLTDFFELHGRVRGRQKWWDGREERGAHFSYKTEWSCKYNAVWGKRSGIRAAPSLTSEINIASNINMFEHELPQP